MAAGDAHVVNSFKEALLNKAISCSADTFKLALYSDAYAAGQIDGAAVAYSSTNEISAANYTAGGQSVGTCTVTRSDASDNVKWDDDTTDAVWNNLGAATIQRAVLYDDTTTPKYACIIWEIGTNSNGGNYTLQFNTAGMLVLS